MNHSSRLCRFGYLAPSLAAVALAAFALVAPAHAAPVTGRTTVQKPTPTQTQAQAASGSQAMQVASSGDWAVFTAGSGKSKVCYALSRPKDRQPVSLKRDPGYMFVSFRPADKVNGELAIVVGFPTNGAGELIIGTTKFSLLSKGPNVWLQDANQEPAVVAAIQKNASKPMLVAVQSARGNKNTDRYSLTGFAGAVARAKQECR